MTRRTVLLLAFVLSLTGCGLDVKLGWSPPLNFSLEFSPAPVPTAPALKISTETQPATRAAR